MAFVSEFRGWHPDSLLPLTGTHPRDIHNPPRHSSAVSLLVVFSFLFELGELVLFSSELSPCRHVVDWVSMLDALPTFALAFRDS